MVAVQGPVKAHPLFIHSTERDTGAMGPSWFAYLLMVYLITLSVVHYTAPNGRRLVNNELKKFGWKHLWLNLGYHPNIFLEEQ
jgi:hypothetical protein